MNKSSHKAYGRALYELTLDKRAAGLEKAIKNFVAHLAKARMLKQASAIISEFTHYAKAQEGIVEIQIQSARELPAAALNQVKKTFGEKVEAVSVVDESLLGGVVIKTKDRILDGSLKTQLRNLQVKLSS
ncbi:MAG: ATP synthase F1 subunit delta [Patescibacteria group bacterium]